MVSDVHKLRETMGISYCPFNASSKNPDEKALDNSKGHLGAHFATSEFSMILGEFENADY